ncbi:MAG: hypothetical protein HC773_05645 [Scytonema sp. CRU_2_7]|nr:hypothetical protein [Scytonema sp. CRU_2_7]
MIRYYQSLPHQEEAIAYLESQISEDVSQQFLAIWRSPQPSKKDYFEIAYAFTSEWEGGFVDHPSDPGGRTNYGIIQTNYDAWRKMSGLPLQDVWYMDKSEAIAIYRQWYWYDAECHRMVAPLAVVHFDTCVNFGVTGGFQFLQEAIGVEADGQWGNITEKAFLDHNTKQTALDIINRRINYRYQRCEENPSQQVFLEGWLNRDQSLRKYIEGM